MDAYEPDPVHRKIAKTNFIINKSKILLKEEAVGNFEGKIQFTRIKNNTTASFIGNHKKTKGKTKKFFVKVIDSKSLKNKYDLIFFDGNHSKDATLKYFNWALESHHRDAIFIFDDIYWSLEMKQAWLEICSNPKTILSINQKLFLNLNIKKL